MNPNRDGIEGPLIAEPEANHGESVTPSNDAQIAPLQRLSFQMSILLKLAKVSDLLALLQPIRRLQDLHLNLHRFPLKAKHYLR